MKKWTSVQFVSSINVRASESGCGFWDLLVSSPIPVPGLHCFNYIINSFYNNLHVVHDVQFLECIEWNSVEMTIVIHNIEIVSMTIWTNNDKNANNKYVYTNYSIGLDNFIIADSIATDFW